MAVLDFLTRKIRYSKVLPLVEEVEKMYKRPLKVLDAGGAAGDFHKILRERGHQVLVCDIDSSADVTVNLEKPLPFNDREFDLAVSLAVIEHLNNWEQFLKELKRVSRNVIITTPTPLGKPVLELLAFFNLVNKEHIRDHKIYLGKDSILGAGYCYSKFLFGLNSVGWCFEPDYYSGE